MIKKVFCTIAIFVALLALLSSCTKEKYPNPSKEFYVNDFADALLPGSRQTFLAEGERLYVDTKNEPNNGGAQVVVVTMLVESEEKADEIDRTELFRQWRIGKNDMGLLILLLFVEDGEEKLLVKTEIEIGYRMEQYVTAARAGDVIDNCLYNPEWEGSLDMGLGEMYYSLLDTIYTQAYGYSSFDYDMEVYRQHLINAEDEDTQIPMSLIAYLFSPYSSVWSKIFTVLGFLLLSGGGIGIFAVRKRGGGGSSGGYGVGRK